MNTPWDLTAALAQALLHSLWQIAALALLAALSFALLARASARLRHAVGMGWLIAMLIAPLLSFAWAWQEPALQAWEGPPGLMRSTPAAALTAPGGTAAPHWLDWLLFALAPLWLGGVLMMGLRQLGGWRLLRRVESRSFTELPPHWQQRVDELARRMGIARQVSVRLAAHIAAPFSSHALRPLIWLPLSLLSGLPAAQFEALLAHELAHVRRLDWIWNSLQCAIEVLLFHHPAMWWLSRRIREEREHACDDLAVLSGGDAIALAEALTRLQIDEPLQRTLVLAAGGGSLLARVRHLLAGGPRRPGWRAPGMLLLLLSAGALLTLVLTRPPHLLTKLHTDASSTGRLTPGHYREYIASYLGEPQRRYRIAMDAQGQLSEDYREDGQPRPIDDGVRHWLRGVQAMSATPDAFPAPPTEPQHPPEPPLFADLDGSEAIPPATSEEARSERFMADESQALAEQLQRDPRLTAITGQPARFKRASFHGGIQIGGAPWKQLFPWTDPIDGRARFHMDFEGPRGRVRLNYSGHTDAKGHWQAERFELTPLP